MINITEKDLEKLKKIGNGQFGEVYQVNENTAYKIYFKEINHKKKGKIKNPALVNPIYRLKKLKKYGKYVKNTDFFIDYVYIDGIFGGISIPYYNGITLNKTKDFDLNKKLDIANQLIDNEKELINNGIYHNDIKLKNAIVVDGIVKIIDLDDTYTHIPFLIKEPDHITTNNSLYQTVIDLFEDKPPFLEGLYDYLGRKPGKASSDLTMLYHYLSEKRKKDDYLIIHPNTNIEDIKSLLKEHQYRIIYLEDENISDNNYQFEIILQYRKNNIALYDIVESNNLENYMKNYNIGKCLIR